MSESGSDDLKGRLDKIARDHSSNPVLSQARDVDVHFIGGPLEQRVTNAQEEVDVKWQGALRTRTVGYKDGLVSLRHEQWFLVDHSEVPVDIDMCYLGGASQSRALLSEILANPKHKTLQDLSKAASKAESQLLPKDRFVKLELDFFAQVDKQLALRLNVLLLKALPTAVAYKDVEVVLAALAAIKSSPMVMMGSGTLASQVTSLTLVLTNIQSGVSPDAGLGKNNPVFQGFLNRCQYFFKATIRGAGVGPNVTKFGTQALLEYQAQPHADIADDAHSVSVADMETMRPFFWLLSKPIIEQAGGASMIVGICWHGLGDLIINITDPLIDIFHHWSKIPNWNFKRY